MKLFNTLTRHIDELKPINPPAVTVYTCGPTVYDYAHVGHWFTYIRWDTLIRSLKASGYTPEWVMNITDVGHLVSDADEGEDKLEKGAKREGKTAWEVADFYTKDFLREMKSLNILMPNHLPKATDHIKEQIALVESLEQKGYTYVTSDGVYYDTSKFPAYSTFARLDIEEQQAGARVEYNPEKRNTTDFALWKFSPKDTQRDMEWDSQWGKGFPGWHIECSAMSMKYLGQTLDIHTGGIDHIPVHHTNEIAQSEAVTGKPFANIWLHSNHVLIEGSKISKSLGNGIRLSDITDKGISLEAFRLHVLESHYRSQSKFSWDSLEAAGNRLQAYQAMADQRWQTHENGTVTASDIEKAENDIKTALQNDLDTPTVLATLSRLEGTIDTGGIRTSNQDSFQSFLTFIDSVLGLTLGTRGDITSEQKQLITQREVARTRRDWAESDRIRGELSSQRIGLRDTDRGVLWRHL